MIVNRYAVGFLVFLCFGVAIYLTQLGEDEPIKAKTEIIKENSEDEQNNIKLLNGVYYDQESEFAKYYNAADSTIRRDLEILETVLEDAVILVKDFASLPLAENRDFTRLLTGNNKQKFGWILPDHSSLSREGELMDRFGSPIFFHRESALITEVRSAGEDRKMWTDDDVFLEPN